MYLARIALNPFKRSTRELIRDTQKLHSAVQTLFGNGFPADPTGKARDRGKGSAVPLWRLDAGSDSMFLLSCGFTEPNVAVMDREYGFDGAGLSRAEDYTSALAHLAPGTVMDFRFTGNVVRRHCEPRVGDRRNPTTRTIAVLDPMEQIQWLVRQGRAHGFEIGKGVTTETDRDSFVKPDRNRVTLFKTRFEGKLRVTDPVALRTAMREGIGRGRAYGCGMLTVSQ